MRRATARDKVERRFLERQCVRVGTRRRDVCRTALRTERARLSEHLRCEVHRNHVSNLPRQGQRRVSRACSHVQGNPGRFGLGKLRHQLAVLERRQARLERTIPRLQAQLTFRQARLAKFRAEEQLLSQRLERFKAENAANAFPIRAIFRLDAGFGTRENVALLIEMGYQVYTKPYSDWLIARFKRQVNAQTVWTQVGGNAKMVAWQSRQLKDFPYPLDIALQRFQTGDTQRYSALLHFGDAPVTSDLPGWFHFYNARQTIEAGIKEGKQVFQMHHLKVRSLPALYLQEQFAVFAANFVRWAAYWLATQCPQLPNGWQLSEQPDVKEQVQVGAHTSAWVSWQEQGCLLRFTDHSVFAGRSLQVKNGWACQLALPFREKAKI